MIRSNREPDGPARPDGLDAAFSVPFVHRLRFCDDALGGQSRVLADLLIGEGGEPGAVLPVVDGGLLEADPSLADRLADLARNHRGEFRFTGAPHVLPGGEAGKNGWQATQALLGRIADDRLDRRGYVLAIGGGAALDVAGFAASLAHRGLRLVRMPSTTLAQADSGVGVKNGVNAFGQKNFLGVFAPPWAVVNDWALLNTLDARRWREGFVEAVKVALIKDRSLFERIERDADAIVRRQPAPSRHVVRRSAELHARHIAEGGDPFETTAARPLDFGHWAAHRLEVATGFRLGHGEAVAIGLALDSAYAARVGMLDDDDLQRIVDLLERLGFRLGDPALAEPDELMLGLEQFREHLGGPLTVTLPQRIGVGRDVHEIDPGAMRQAIGAIAARARAAAPSPG